MLRVGWSCTEAQDLKACRVSLHRGALAPARWEAGGAASRDEQRVCHWRVDTGFDKVQMGSGALRTDRTVASIKRPCRPRPPEMPTGSLHLFSPKVILAVCCISVRLFRPIGVATGKAPWPGRFGLKPVYRPRATVVATSVHAQGEVRDAGNAPL